MIWAFCISQSEWDSVCTYKTMKELWFESPNSFWDEKDRTVESSWLELTRSVGDEFQLSSFLFAYGKKYRTSAKVPSNVHRRTERWRVNIESVYTMGIVQYSWESVKRERERERGEFCKRLILRPTRQADRILQLPADVCLSEPNCNLLPTPARAPAAAKYSG